MRERCGPTALQTPETLFFNIFSRKLLFLKREPVRAPVEHTTQNPRPADHEHRRIDREQ